MGTPFLYAAHNGDVDIMNLLLKNGADIRAKDLAGKTGMDYLDGEKKELIIVPEKNCIIS